MSKSILIFDTLSTKIISINSCFFFILLNILIPIIRVPLINVLVNFLFLRFSFISGFFRFLVSILVVALALLGVLKFRFKSAINLTFVLGYAFTDLEMK